MASPIRPNPPGYTNPTPTRDKTGKPLPPKPGGTMGGGGGGRGRGHMGPGSGLAPKPGESKTDYQGRVRDMKAAGVKPTTSGRMGNDISPRRVTGGMGSSSSSSDRSEKMRAASEKAASQKESQMKMRAAAAKASEMKARTMGGAASKMGPGSVRTGAPVMRAKGGMVKGKK